MPRSGAKIECVLVKHMRDKEPAKLMDTSHRVSTRDRAVSGVCISRGGGHQRPRNCDSHSLGLGGSYSGKAQWAWCGYGGIFPHGQPP